MIKRFKKTPPPKSDVPNGEALEAERSPSIPSIVVLTKRARLWKLLQAQLKYIQCECNLLNPQELFSRIDEWQPDLIIYDVHQADPPPLETSRLLKNCIDIELLVICPVEEMLNFYHVGSDLCLPEHGLEYTIQKVAQSMLSKREDKLKYSKMHRKAEGYRQMLLSQQKETSLFVGKLSHEIRTPLGVIEGFTINLLDGLAGAITDEQKDSLEVIQRNIQGLKQYLGELLKKSEAESHQFERQALSRTDLPQRRSPQKRRHLPIWPILREVLELFKASFQRKTISVQLSIPKDLPRLWMVESKIRQVFTNLLSNACKYTQEGGQVWVRACVLDEKHKPLKESRKKRKKSTVLLEIIDNGPGIPKSYLADIFEQFTRAQDTSDTIEGSGLGLSICKEIIDEHNGHIKIQSKQGKGTKISLFLPIDLRRRKKGNILLLKNQELFLELYGRLERMHLEIQELSNPEDIQELLRNRSHDFLMIDSQALRNKLRTTAKKERD